MELTPDSMGRQDAYKLLIGAIVPRPIAFVSTVSQAGVRNLAAFSFFTGVCPKPLIIAFAPMNRPNDGSKKDTLVNIETTKQFVVNIVTEDIVNAMNLTAPDFAPEVDEFEVAGFTPVPSIAIEPPRVLESPINMECELVDIIRVEDGSGGSNLVLGKVVHMHVRDDIYYDGKIDITKLKPVARLAGDHYAKTTDLFTLKRPVL